MYGAILGDIIGSPFEFDRGDKTKNFDLFSEGCGFTDDSVMTIAVGEALLAVGPEAAVKKIEDAVASNMQDWGKRYPHAGYGGSFRHAFPHTVSSVEWHKSGVHYVITLYKADKFTGELKSSEEGRVYWIPLEELKTKELATGMEHVLRILESEKVDECYMHLEADGYVGDLY